MTIDLARRSFIRGSAAATAAAAVRKAFGRPLTESEKILFAHIIDVHWEKSAGAAKKFIGMKTKMFVADSIEALAEKMGADPKTLAATVAEYNRALGRHESALQPQGAPAS